MWDLLNKVACRFDVQPNSSQPSGSQFQDHCPPSSRSDVTPSTGANPGTSDPGTVAPFVAGPVYKRVTAPTARPASPPPSLGALGQLPLSVADPAPSPGFVGAPHGNSAPVIYPGQFSKRLTEKIAEDEFVEMADILALDNRKYGVVLDSERELNLVSKKAKVLSESQWIRAFCLYSIEYLQHYPDAKIDLLLYAIKITDLMEEPGMDWRFYDRTFRTDRRRLGLSFRHMRLDLESKARRLATSAPGPSSRLPALSVWGGKELRAPCPPRILLSVPRRGRLLPFPLRFQT